VGSILSEELCRTERGERQSEDSRKHDNEDVASILLRGKDGFYAVNNIQPFGRIGGCAVN
jgi:predicted  nucleic acid-binding Zn-ribbon protein